VLTGKAAPSGVVWVDMAFVLGDTVGEIRTAQSLGPSAKCGVSSLHVWCASSKRASQSRVVLPPPRASISCWVGTERMGVEAETCLT
jgi:hypothetical protein